MDLKGTSYIAPVKRENEKISSLVKTASYKTVLILGNVVLIGDEFWERIGADGYAPDACSAVDVVKSLVH